jgi:hypothetical protein
MAAVDGESLFFAKNSDRDSGVPRIIQYCGGSEGLAEPSSHPEHRKVYDRGRYKSLRRVAERYPSSLRALISRPSWMWGAEMGVNELGVAIGNEAIFSLRRTRPDGLLGTDILRLALHNARRAEEAVDIIAGLIEGPGQGGNGSYNGPLRYHNSFLAADRREAWVVETAGRSWAAEKVEFCAAISNDYAIGTGYSRGDSRTLDKRPDFRKRYASTAHRWFTKGDRRRTTAMSMLEQGGPFWDTMRNILVSTEGEAVCMDASASMIVEQRPGRSLVWLTGAPLPVYSPLFPHTVSETAFRGSLYTAPAYGSMAAREKIALTELILTAPPEAKRIIAALARGVEQSCREKVRQPFLSGTEAELDAACAECAGLETGYHASADGILKEYGIDTTGLFEKPSCYYRCG